MAKLAMREFISIAMSNSAVNGRIGHDRKAYATERQQRSTNTGFLPAASVAAAEGMTSIRL